MRQSRCPFAPACLTCRWMNRRRRSSPWSDWIKILEICAEINQKLCGTYPAWHCANHFCWAWASLSRWHPQRRRPTPRPSAWRTPPNLPLSWTCPSTSLFTATNTHTKTWSVKWYFCGKSFEREGNWRTYRRCSWSWVGWSRSVCSILSLIGW